MNNYKIFHNVSYDSLANALYIQIKDDSIDYTEQISENTILDYWKDWDVIGIEILNPKDNQKIVNSVLFSDIDITKWKSFSQIMHYQGAKQEIYK